MKFIVLLQYSPGCRFSGSMATRYWILMRFATSRFNLSIAAAVGEIRHLKFNQEMNCSKRIARRPYHAIQRLSLSHSLSLSINPLLGMILIKRNPNKIIIIKTAIPRCELPANNVFCWSSSNAQWVVVARIKSIFYQLHLYFTHAVAADLTCDMDRRDCTAAAAAWSAIKLSSSFSSGSSPKAKEAAQRRTFPASQSVSTVQLGTTSNPLLLFILNHRCGNFLCHFNHGGWLPLNARHATWQWYVQCTVGNMGAWRRIRLWLGFMAHTAAAAPQIVLLFWKCGNL